MLVYDPDCCPYVEQAAKHEIQGTGPSRTSLSHIKDNYLRQPVKSWPGNPSVVSHIGLYFHNLVSFTAE